MQETPEARGFVSFILTKISVVGAMRLYPIPLSFKKICLGLLTQHWGLLFPSQDYPSYSLIRIQPKPTAMEMEEGDVEIEAECDSL